MCGHLFPDDRCVLALYFATGVAMLKWQEGWEVTTAIYVVVQVVTTVGQTLRGSRFSDGKATF